MSDKFPFTPPVPVTLRIRDSAQLFPVRRVYCIGRNYADHAREMGHDPSREEPFYFLKPADALDQSGKFPYPPATESVHYEVELVVLLKEGGKNISPDAALDCVFGYAVGLDMTRRDLQQIAKNMGRPWEVAKAFDHSAPCSEVVLAKVIGHPDSGAITLERNGKTVQSGDLSQQIWSVPEIISYLSTQMELAPGDVIMTGTPAGVGAVARGDRLDASIEAVGNLAVNVV